MSDDNSHTDELRDVREGDELQIITSENEVFSATCTSVEQQHADPRSGEIRQTTIWTFDTSKGELACSILDGLSSSKDDPEFPQYSQLWALDKKENIGYITGVK